MPNADDSLPPSSQTLLKAFESLVTVLNEYKIRYAIIGGLAMPENDSSTRTAIMPPCLGTVIAVIRLKDFAP